MSHECAVKMLARAGGALPCGLLAGEVSAVGYDPPPCCSHDRQQTSSRAETERGVELNLPFEYVLNLVILPKEKYGKGNMVNASLTKQPRLTSPVRSPGDVMCS